MDTCANGGDNITRIKCPWWQPVDTGKTVSLLICVSVQSIRSVTYCGAGNAVGFLYFSPSAHRYSKRAPPLIVGQEAESQYSDMVPYMRFILLKKSTTAMEKLSVVIELFFIYIINYMLLAVCKIKYVRHFLIKYNANKETQDILHRMFFLSRNNSIMNPYINYY